jgi:hypothetical protein
MSQLSGDLNRYTLGEPLGIPGGYGAAFRALRDDGTPCVVKLLHGFRNPSHEALLRLEVVLARLEQVSSDHVVPIIDAGLDEGQIGGPLPWLAMRELPGARSLRQVIDSGDSVDIQRVAADLANGLADLYEIGALHRDLKPGNVLIDAKGRAWLIDFELIKILDLATRTPRHAEPVGTELYMAPEQFLGPVLPQSDLWALGLVLVELLTGRQPLAEVARRGGSIRRVALAQPLVPVGLSEPWGELVSVLLRKLPARRPGDARAVARWIECPTGPPPAPAAVVGSPPFRWSVRLHAEVDAAELVAARGLVVPVIDVDGPATARVQRLRRAARRMGAALSVDAPPRDIEQLSIEDVIEGTAAPDAEVERFVLSRLRAQRDSLADIILLPWHPADEVGIDDAIHTLRLGLRHRHMAGTRPVVATVQCSLASLVDQRRALAFGAALTALDPDGWRLLVDGLDPGCSARSIAAVMDMASALASRADVWVRSNNVFRWALTTVPGVSVMYRAGRDLWTRKGRGQPRFTPERVEVASLAGPIPRWVAERLAVSRPELLACSCPACAGQILPLPGQATVAHNVWTVTSQLSGLRAIPDGDRRLHVSEQLERARQLRASLSPLVGWGGEVRDVDAVLCALSQDLRPSGGRRSLVEFA